jgi:hypothetical protein
MAARREPRRPAGSPAATERLPARSGWCDERVGSLVDRDDGRPPGVPASRTLATGFLANHEDESSVDAKQAPACTAKPAGRAERSMRTGPIPGEVKRAVWARDGGHCAECRHDCYLEVDPIIPHSQKWQEHSEIFIYYKISATAT